MVLVEIACIILFTLFSLIYLIVFQADLLFYCQNLLSDGATSYSPVLGGVIITVTALLLRFMVRGFFPKKQTASVALSYLPSALAMGVLTSVHPVSNTSMDFGGAVWGAVTILLMVAVLVWFINKARPFDSDTSVKGWLFRVFWMNLGVMAGVFVLCGMVGNANESDHLRLRMERMILEGNVNEAVALSKNNCEKDTSMLMLRAYAFGKHRQLGGSFFTPFPENTTSNMLIPTSTNNLTLLTTSEGHIAELIGGRGVKGLSARQTLTALANKGKLTKTGKQYLLMAYLLDRDLDAFMKYLPKVFDDMDTLPRNIAEAVVLYESKHPRSKSNYELGDAEKRYEYFLKEQSLMKKGSKTKADGSPLYWHSLKDDFGDTYWYYYCSKNR